MAFRGALRNAHTGGSSPDAVDMDEVTVIFIADAIKLVPTAEEWPQVRRSPSRVDNPFLFTAQPLYDVAFRTLRLEIDNNINVLSSTLLLALESSEACTHACML